MTAAMTFAERRDRLNQIDAEIDARPADVQCLRELVHEESELLAEPFMVSRCEKGLAILIDRDVAVAEIHEYYEALTSRHILHGLARGGEFSTKAASYKAAE